VQNDIAGNYVVRVMGWIQTTQIYTHISIRVCGQERVKLSGNYTLTRKYAAPFVPTTTEAPASGLSDTERYFTVTEQDFRSFFTA
jgi:hypothetical protein